MDYKQKSTETSDSYRNLSGAEFLLESSSKTCPNHTQNKLVSSLKHEANKLNILPKESYNGVKVRDFHH